jgi:hypothetical protein
MCMLLFRPAGLETDIPVAWIDHFWARNAHGFGAFWRNGPKAMEIKRTLDKDEAREIIQWIVKEKVAAGLHWRHATSGSHNLQNVHPFVVTQTSRGDPSLVVAHNGVMSEWTKLAPKDGSDTMGYVSRLLMPLMKMGGPKNVYLDDTPASIILLASLGNDNRLLFGHPSLGWMKYGRWYGGNFRGMEVANTYAWNANRRTDDTPEYVAPPSATVRSHGYSEWWKQNQDNYPASHLGGNLTEKEQDIPYWEGPFELGKVYPLRGGMWVKIMSLTEPNAHFPILGHLVSVFKDGKARLVGGNQTYTIRGHYINGEGVKHRLDIVGPASNVAVGESVSTADRSLAPPADAATPTATPSSILPAPSAGVAQLACKVEGHLCEPVCPGCQERMDVPRGASLEGQAPLLSVGAVVDAATGGGTPNASAKDAQSSSGGQSGMVKEKKNNWSQSFGGDSSLDAGDGSDDDDDVVVDGLRLSDFLGLGSVELVGWCQSEPESAAEAIESLAYSLLMERRRTQWDN